VSLTAETAEKVVGLRPVEVLALPGRRREGVADVGGGGFGAAGVVRRELVRQRGAA
jgi:hypothetical protein